MKKITVFIWAIAMGMTWSTGALAANKSKKTQKNSKEACFTRLDQLDPMTVRPIFDAFIQSKSKKSFWGPVITVGGPPESCKKRKNKNRPECLPTEENKPTQILIGKHTGKFQILRDWDQNPKSKKANGYPLTVCSDKQKTFPVHLSFDLDKWFGTAHVETEIKPKNDWMKTANKKELSITTMVAVNGGAPSLYKKSTLDIQPMINQYLASMTPAAPPVAEAAPVANTAPAVAVAAPLATPAAQPNAAEAEGQR